MWLGVDHIYVYDNNDTKEAMETLLRPYTQEHGVGFATHLHLPPNALNYQLDVYNHCVHSFGEQVSTSRQTEVSLCADICSQRT